ncbi:MBL fold metallo-hydrolase [Jannaschia sp. R86511]|uniref:MBL fold metallo-hydrolase n=1 Tax=Jannaschia sp. R86511 TaxID=3093853 RepID=UPI0036D2B9A5
MTVLAVGDPRLPALHVDRSDAPVHVDLGAALLSKASVSEQDNTAYVLTCRATGAQLLVDAADDPEAVLGLVGAAAAAAGPDVAGAPDVVAVVTTHGHWDHHRALPAVAAAVAAPVLCGRDDAGDLPVAVDRLLDHGDVVVVGDLRLDVVHLRGHTPGSVALVLPASGAVPAVALTGDSLFPGGVGNTWQDPERFVSLLGDVEERLFARFGDDTLVLPGHGDGTTLGAERPALPVWRERGW